MRALVRTVLDQIVDQTGEEGPFLDRMVDQKVEKDPFLDQMRPVQHSWEEERNNHQKKDQGQMEEEETKDSYVGAAETCR